MKLSFEKATLMKALSHVQSVVERRNTIPILSNVLLEAQGDRVCLTATDLDLQIVETIPAQVEEDGAATVNAHTLFDLVRKLKDGAQVALAANGDGITLVSGGFKSKLATLPREDFPKIADDALPTRFSLPILALRQALDRTKFAMSTEETRYYLNGIYIHVTEDGHLRTVATDGHRLARVTLPMPEGAAGMPGVIVPRKAIAEIRKLLEEDQGEVVVSLSESKIRFELGDAILTSKLIDGTFPDYTRVIPTSNDRLLRIDPRLLSDAVDRVATIATDKTRAVKLTLEQDKVILSVSAQDQGVASEEVAAVYDAGPLSVGYNARYLREVLDQMGGGEVEMHLADASAPTLLRESAGAPALYVLMPMRV